MFKEIVAPSVKDGIDFQVSDTNIVARWNQSLRIFYVELLKQRLNTEEFCNGISESMVLNLSADAEDTLLFLRSQR